MTTSTSTSVKVGTTIILSGLAVGVAFGFAFFTLRKGPKAPVANKPRPTPSGYTTSYTPTGYTPGYTSGYRR